MKDLDKEFKELDKEVELMKKAQYIRGVIATAIHNGMSIEQMIEADPKDLVKAHHNAQLKAIKQAGEKLQDQYAKAGRIFE